MIWLIGTLSLLDLFIYIKFNIFVQMNNNNRIRAELIKMIMIHNTMFAINSVGGYERFKRIMNITSPTDFLNLFLDIPYETRGGVISCNDLFFKYNNSSIKMIFSQTNNHLIVNNCDFPMSELFSLPLRDLETIIKDWFFKTYCMPTNIVWFSKI